MSSNVSLFDNNSSVQGFSSSLTGNGLNACLQSMEEGGVGLVPLMNNIIHENLIDHVKDYALKKDRLALKKIIDEMRPADVADLIEHLGP